MGFYKRHKHVIDQGLHVVVFGFLAWVHPSFGIAAVAVYELADWHVKLGPLSIGQWPPGRPYLTAEDYLDERGVKMVRIQAVTQRTRVEDLRIDMIYELAGCALGAVLGRLL